MTLADKWKTALSLGLYKNFSPSGHALVVQPMRREPFMQVIEVHSEEGREPRVVEFDNVVTPLAWASDTELVYRDSGAPLDEWGDENKASLRVFGLESGESRPLLGADCSMSVIRSGRSGHLSVLAEPDGQAGLFDLDVETGVLERLTGFDAALSRLEVYPLFRHAFCPARQEVALLAWPLGEYLPPDVEPTEANSHWLPILDDPTIQDFVDVRPDGTRVTPRERTREAKRKTGFRLFLLNANGECQEVAGTRKAHHPLWSPDGAMLSFERWADAFAPRHTGESVSSVWLLRRSDLSLTRLGGYGGPEQTTMHPSGILLCELEDETIPFDADKGRTRARSARWTGFALRNSEAFRL